MNNLFEVLAKLGAKIVCSNDENQIYDTSKLKFKPANEKREFGKVPINSSIEPNNVSNLKSSTNTNRTVNQFTNNRIDFTQTKNDNQSINNNNFNSNAGLSSFNTAAVNPKDNRKKLNNDQPNEYDDQWDDGFDDLFTNEAVESAFIDPIQNNFQTSSTIKSTKPSNISSSKNQSSNLNDNSSITILNSKIIENVTINTTDNVTLGDSNRSIGTRVNLVDDEIIVDEQLNPVKISKYNFDTTNETTTTASIFKTNKNIEDDDCLVLSDDEDLLIEEVQSNYTSSNNLNNNVEIKPTCSKYFSNDDPLTATKIDSNELFLSDSIDFDEDILLNDENDVDVSFNVSKLNYSADLTSKFVGFYKNDGDQEKFKRKNYPFSARLIKEFDDTFGLKEFRTNQLETMNAIMLNNDTFVLMPTGGSYFSFT